MGWGTLLLSHLPLSIAPFGVVGPNPIVNRPGEASQPDIVAVRYGQAKEEVLLVTGQRGEVPSVAHTSSLCFNPAQLVDFMSKLN